LSDVFYICVAIVAVAYFAMVAVAALAKAWENRKNCCEKEKEASS